MRLPTELLSSVRGPALVLAIAGCVPAAAPSVTIEPEPTPVAVVEADPVPYDERAETERLALAELDVGATARRNRRIAANVAAARPIARAPSNVNRTWAVRCGRG